jgi:hypothetical protein
MARQMISFCMGFVSATVIATFVYGCVAIGMADRNNAQDKVIEACFKHLREVDPQGSGSLDLR